MDDDGDTNFDRAERFVYDGSDAVLVFDDAGSLTNRYLSVLDELFASEDDVGEVLWSLPDHQGTVRDIADYDAVGDTTTVENHLQYDAFGRITSETDPSVDFLARYTGEYFDEDLGLQRHGRRWYDPAVGRWLSEDPIGFDAGDVNLSRYVMNSPVIHTDPTGLRLYDVVQNVVSSFQDTARVLTQALKPIGSILQQTASDLLTQPHNPSRVSASSPQALWADARAQLNSLGSTTGNNQQSLTQANDLPIMSYGGPGRNCARCHPKQQWVRSPEVNSANNINSDWSSNNNIQDEFFSIVLQGHADAIAEDRRIARRENWKTAQGLAQGYVNSLNPWSEAAQPPVDTLDHVLRGGQKASIVVGGTAAGAAGGLYIAGATGLTTLGAKSVTEATTITYATAQSAAFTVQSNPVVGGSVIGGLAAGLESNSKTLSGKALDVGAGMFLGGLTGWANSPRGSSTSPKYQNGRGTALHYTNDTGKQGIEESRYLNGPYSVWTFDTNAKPSTKLGAAVKSLVRPSRLTDTVEDINASGLIKPKIRGPWSLFQRLSGVKRTPGPGTYQIDTGEFYPNQLYDKSTNQLRPMTTGELIRGGKLHDAALETIGYGSVSIPPLLYWHYQLNSGDAND